MPGQLVARIKNVSRKPRSRSEARLSGSRSGNRGHGAIGVQRSRTKVRFSGQYAIAREALLFALDKPWGKLTGNLESIRQGVSSCTSEMAPSRPNVSS